MGTEAEQPYTVMDRSQCWAHLRDARVGRLAVIVDDGPEIFPVNHVVDRGSVVFRTAAGAKLHGAVGRRVAFEVDGYDADTNVAWSVVAKGRAREVRRTEEVLDAMGIGVHPWHSGSKPRFVRIDPDEVSGRSFQVS
jgi:uncharacterized protein